MSESGKNRISEIVPQPSRKARIGVVETIYHRLPQQQPFSIEERYSKELETTEQPYARRMTLKESAGAIPLDCGWIKDLEFDGCSMLHIANDSGLSPNVIPTKEQKEDIVKRMVMLLVRGEDGSIENATPFALIRPGESIRFTPLNTHALCIECIHQEAVIVITAFPK